ncbi:ANTAR domain-containing protein [Streptomyces sp. WAC 01529]|uniref:ANTAR domain-containing protein n=1 Tax=Streptomyces sp. WAC 01529 TaxID=2203205 RepID=UPI001F0C7C24|nr:ANTAR domain-containing protein [Streptomyces sp. WAC 01529]
MPTTVDVVPGSYRMSVLVRGQLDLHAGRRLRSGLRHTVSRPTRAIDLDLSGVRFCDCSGLNLLLSLRQWALEQGKAIVISASSPAVERILDLTGTRDLFSAEGLEEERVADPVARETDPVTRDAGPVGCETGPRDGDAVPRGESEQELRAEVAQLRRAMETRPTIDLARGILMSSFQLSPEAAWEVLVTTSQNTNTKLYRLAEDLVAAVQGGALPEAVREQMAAAVAKTTNTAQQNAQ